MFSKFNDHPLKKEGKFSHPLERDLERRSDLEGYQTPRTIRPQGAGSNLDAELWQGLNPEDITDITDGIAVDVGALDVRIGAVEGDYVPVGGGTFTGPIQVFDSGAPVFNYSGGVIGLLTNTASNIGIWMQPIMNQDVSNLRGMQIQPSVESTVAGMGAIGMEPHLYPAASLSLAYGTIRLTRIGNATRDNNSYNVTKVYNVFDRVDLISGYVGTVGKLHVYRIHTVNKVEASAVINELAGVAVGSLSAGANNYAILTEGTTQSSFGGNVNAGSFSAGGLPGKNGTVTLASITQITVSGGIITGWA